MRSARASMDAALLVACLVSVQVQCAVEESRSDICQLQDGVSLLQLDERATFDESHVTSAHDCKLSAEEDSRQMVAYIRENRNQSVIDRYKEEGKISQHGMPILQLVHIPKTGGDAIKTSGAPIGEYGFGTLNKAWKDRPQDFDEAYEKGCWVDQSPPMDLSQSFAEWIYGESEVFCVVRDPFLRLISAACHLLQYELGASIPFDAASIDKFIQVRIQIYKKYRNVETCFFIPQVEYLKGQFGCKHVLDFDNFEPEFNGLMKQYGMSEITLVPAGATHICSTKCNVTKSDLSAETIEMMEVVYGEDIKLWEDLRHNRSVGGLMYGR